MSLFGKKNDFRLQSFVLKLVNNNYPGLKAQIEGPRLDNRITLVMVVLVVPVDDGRLRFDQAFTALTKDFSTIGVGVVIDQFQTFSEVILGFHFEGETTFIRARAKHIEPMGGGFYHIGFHMQEIVPLSDHPELAALKFWNKPVEQVLPPTPASEAGDLRSR